MSAVAMFIGAFSTPYQVDGTLNGGLFPYELLKQAERNVFKAVKPLSNDGFNAMPEMLWLENTISNSKSSYQFNLQQNQNTTGQNPKTRQLDFQDVMVVIGFNFGFYEGTTATPAEIKPGGLQFAPADDYFDLSGATFVPGDLFQLYTGSLEVKIGTNVIIEALALQDALYIPQNSQGSPSTQEYTQTSIGAGTIVLPTHLILQGSQQNVITLNVNTYNGILWEQDAAGKSVQIVLRPIGIKLKGIGADANGGAMEKMRMLLGTIN